MPDLSDNSDSSGDWREEIIEELEQIEDPSYEQVADWAMTALVRNKQEVNEARAAVDEVAETLAEVEGAMDFIEADIMADIGTSDDVQTIDDVRDLELEEMRDRLSDGTVARVDDTRDELIEKNLTAKVRLNALKRHVSKLLEEFDTIGDLADRAAGGEITPEEARVELRDCLRSW